MKKHIHGGNVYQYRDCVDFSANCNPLGTPEGVKKAVVESLDHISEYPQVGYEPLKKALAEYEGVFPEQVICGNGAAELIFSLCRAGKPSRALIPVPTFAEYEQALLSVGCKMEYYYMEEEENFTLTEEFLKALHKELDILFLCNPNNPTGQLIAPALMERIAEKCMELEIFLVVDECFLDFTETPETYTLKEKLEKIPGLFLLKAFTKRYAMAGLRLGYGLCANKKLLEQMELVTQPWNISTVAQAAGLAALKEQAYVKAGRELVFQEAQWLTEKMRELGLLVYQPEANYVFFKGPKDLFSQAVKEHVLIRDCSNYEGLCKGYFRVAVKTHKENIQLIKALEKILREETGTWQKRS